MAPHLLKKLGLKFSLNDPRWGRGSQNDEQSSNQNGKQPSDGPPDLDQLWRDFNQRVNRFFGRRSSGGGGSSGGGFRPDMRGMKIGAGIIVIIVLLLWLLSGFFIVQEGQTGVVMTFGRYSHMANAGFNWHWPAPIQKHEIVNVSSVRTVEVGYRSSVRNKVPREALMLTEDENIIDIQFAVQYKLKDASDWVFNNRDKQDTIKQVAESAIREVVGRSQMDFVLYEGREKVAQEVAQLMQQILDRYSSGAQITNVTMQGVQPPEQVQAAFDDAVKAGQDRERLKNEGQAYANDVVPRARGTASRLLQEADGYRAKVIANAEGETARFKQILTQYQKAPAVTRDRMYIDTMQQIFSSTTKLMVDARTNNSLLYLPLDKLIAQSAAAEIAQPHAAAPAATAAPATPAPASTNSAASESQRQIDARSRESRDSRDREGR
ncbi:FtsH protease activity modulator HflK [Noviherbaspirillum pedocola]|uniref:Protein HflK n=1 Tax=Noviherbaspirillum pedocola TaxID=2801341 RepID=A0A934SS44_9BURK|nr:FtsH protease activity modulator HflK [Noviherbaspirillum pedocola]MBK4734465.1 FtsH protease activity modulator HflK [Noviherbaspirillum pedocola]